MSVGTEIYPVKLETKVDKLLTNDVDHLNKLRRLLHGHCLRPNSFQRQLNLGFPCLRFCVLQVKITTICLSKNYCKSFDDLHMLFGDGLVCKRKYCAFCKKQIAVKFF